MKHRWLLVLAFVAFLFSALACEVDVRTKCDDTKELRMDAYRAVCDPAAGFKYETLIRDLAEEGRIVLDDGMIAADVAPADDPDDCDNYLLKDAEECLAGTVACEDEIEDLYDGNCL